jgi:hypothetical protein
MTGVWLEKARLDAIRSAPRPLTGVEQMARENADALRAAQRPPEQRLPTYVQTSLHSYRRLWSPHVDPSPRTCPTCGYPEDVGTHRSPEGGAFVCRHEARP